MKAAIEGINRRLHREVPPISWPTRAKIYGTWGYAFARAFDEARERRQKVYVYLGVLDGERVWVSSLDPKKE